ncbi:MAG TPA: twin-arginine translocase TatA/TatE family subunit [Anaerolineales bacterium]|nr:twin-arginine translocase TatA/TatE family subunit [Anaerolineales bacterium]
MEVFGIGGPELVFIIIIALIVLGPKDMQKAGKAIGHWLNRLVNSDGWKLFQNTSREIRRLPTTLMREANMDLSETEKDLKDIKNAIDPRAQLRSSVPASKPILSSPPAPTADDLASASPANSPTDESQNHQEKDA